MDVFEEVRQFLENIVTSIPSEIDSRLLGSVDSFEAGGKVLHFKWKKRLILYENSINSSTLFQNGKQVSPDRLQALEPACALFFFRFDRNSGNAKTPYSAPLKTQKDLDFQLTTPIRSQKFLVEMANSYDPAYWTNSHWKIGENLDGLVFKPYLTCGIVAKLKHFNTDPSKLCRLFLTEEEAVARTKETWRRKAIPLPEFTIEKILSILGDGETFKVFLEQT